MSKPTTIHEAVTYLYGALDIAGQPRSWIAGALELIEVETERQARYVRELEACIADDREMYSPVMRAEIIADCRRVAGLPPEPAGATNPRQDRDEPRA